MKNATTIICKYCTKKFDYPDYKVRRGQKTTIFAIVHARRNITTNTKSTEQDVPN